MERILIMGLPGAGKTYLAQHVLDHLQSAGKRVGWLNADDVRARFNDWDFSKEGRIRQSVRMRSLADEKQNCHYVICDFVCPLPEMRQAFDPHWVVWVDTIAKGRFEDTNSMFIPPDNYDFRIQTQNAKYFSELIAVSIMQQIRKGKMDVV